MKERPILFSAPMVRAILDGSKTQTRRVVKPQPAGAWAAPGKTACPYGRPGDRLWVREAFRTSFQYDQIKPSLLPVASAARTLAVPFWYDADLDDLEPLHPGLGPGKYRRGMFMPRSASRILLEVVSVRVERLKEISRGDAMAEGCPFPNLNGVEVGRTDPVGWFRELWESINGPGSWDANPWVWVVEFRRVQP